MAIFSAVLIFSTIFLLRLVGELSPAGFSLQRQLPHDRGLVGGLAVTLQPPRVVTGQLQDTDDVTWLLLGPVSD